MTMNGTTISGKLSPLVCRTTLSMILLSVLGACGSDSNEPGGRAGSAGAAGAVDAGIEGGHDAPIGGAAGSSGTGGVDGGVGGSSGASGGSGGSGGGSGGSGGSSGTGGSAGAGGSAGGSHEGDTFYGCWDMTDGDGDGLVDCADPDCDGKPCHFPVGGNQLCDIVETCTNSVCPPDLVQPNTMLCRASAGDCDPAEYCTGGGHDCPPDVLMPGGTICREAVGVCDAAEMCTGGSISCPADVLHQSTQVCRLGQPGTCDLAEACTGALVDCPADSSSSPTSGFAHVDLGYEFGCAVSLSGGVVCWGINADGQLGAGHGPDSVTPVNVSGLGAGVASLAAGSSHACAVTTSGAVKCWGSGWNLELGNGVSTPSFTPVDVTGLSSGVRAVAGGGKHTCAVTTTGGVKCWGANENGQLGDGSKVARPAPTDVSTLAGGVSAIAAGGAHTCALSSSGGVRCWGANGEGQVGDGTVAERVVPTAVSGLASGVAAIDAGGSHTCALTAVGGVKCWGYNADGQLGNGSTASSAIPMDVSGLTAGVAAIAAGFTHTCALMAAGGVKCWGAKGGWPSSTVPVDVAGTPTGIQAIAAGEHTCVLGSTGSVECWRRTADSKTDWPMPVLRPGLESGVASVSAGSEHSCVVTTAGAVKCWGGNDNGQLGDGTTTPRTQPVTVSGLSSGAAKVAAAFNHTCAVTVSGGARCWGDNTTGQLGNGTTSPSAVPVDVSGLSTGVIAIAVGGAGVAGSNTCALLSNGGVKCWGWNTLGQLGNGTTTDSPTPVDVTGLTSGVAAIAMNGSESCALTTGGAVKCWGYGNGYQTRTTPVDVGGLSSGVTLLASGVDKSCALVPSVGVRCWRTEDTWAPIVQGLEPDVIAVAPGLHSCVLTSAGGVRCWGNGYSGQLGNGTLESQNYPVDVVGLTTGVASIAVGGWHTCALTSAGAVKCWGSDAYGQITGFGSWQPAPLCGP